MRTLPLGRWPVVRVVFVTSILLLLAEGGANAKITWSGVWDVKGSGYNGRYTLIQSGKSVSGSCDWLGGCTVSGNLSADGITWKGTSVAKDARYGTSKFEFTMNIGGLTFSGGGKSTTGAPWSEEAWCISGPCLNNGAEPPAAPPAAADQKGPGAEGEYTVSYRFAYRSFLWEFMGHGTLRGSSMNTLKPVQAAADADENVLRLFDNTGRTRIAVELEVSQAKYSHVKGAQEKVLLTARIKESAYPSCPKGTTLQVVVAGAPKEGEIASPSEPGVPPEESLKLPREAVVRAYWSGQNPPSQCPLARYLSPRTTEVRPVVRSGLYRATVNKADDGKSFESSWRLNVDDKGNITGSSSWDCCPGPRTDPLVGYIARDGGVYISRDCGEMIHLCKQHYLIKRQTADGTLYGSWNGTGASKKKAGADHVTLHCTGGACMSSHETTYVSIDTKVSTP